MALIKCIDCGKEFSGNAPACIHCGCPTQRTLDALKKEEASSIEQSEDIEAVCTQTYERDQYDVVAGLIVAFIFFGAIFLPVASQVGKLNIVKEQRTVKVDCDRTIDGYLRDGWRIQSQSTAVGTKGYTMGWGGGMRPKECLITTYVLERGWL